MGHHRAVTVAHGPCEALGRDPSSLPHHSLTQPPPDLTILPRARSPPRRQAALPDRAGHRSSGLVLRIALESSGISLCLCGLRWCHGSVFVRSASASCHHLTT
ncbi:hypothetical protein EJB05_07950, partial [Eragrostis curvula]